MTDDELLTERQATELLRLTGRTLATWRHRGQGPPWVKVGRFVRYRRTAIETWLDENTPASRAYCEKAA